MRYLIDIGSSTIKVYSLESDKLEKIFNQSLDFKKDFSNTTGISEENKKQLCKIMSKLIKDYNLNNANTKIYATGVHRKFSQKKEFIEWFYVQTQLYFNIISQDLEAGYLNNLWEQMNKKNRLSSVVINIGGGSTEIIKFINGEKIGDPIKLSLSVGYVMKEFEGINEQKSTYAYEEVVSALCNRIEEVIGKQNDIFKTAIYTGGELSYMKKVAYNLKDNCVINDKDHPCIISIKDFEKRNTEIFEDITISELRNMMPENPTWMDGARPCSALADAILRYYHVTEIIPSDSNLIDGVVCREAEKVVLCGSFNKHLPQIAAISKELKNKGIRVLSPKSTELADQQEEGDFLIFKEDVIENHNTWDVEKKHLKAIDESDFVIACNFENYLGVSTTFELDYAYRKGKKIVFLYDNDVARDFKERFDLERFPCEIGLI